MKPQLKLEERTVVLAFEHAAELHAFLDQARERQRFVVKLRHRLDLAQSLRFELDAPGEAPRGLEAEVIQVFRSGAELLGTVCRVTSWGSEAGTETTEPEPPAEGAQASNDAEETTETTGHSPTFHIKRMNVTQKMRLATKAKRTERAILLRDHSPQVMMGLLANPQIEDKEVLEIVKSSYAASGVLQRVASDRKWAGNYEIQLALVKNPKTPSPLALRLLDTLRTKDLQVLAKSSHTRDDVKKASLRVFLKRSQSR